MDRALIERMVGAGVLVLVLVLFAPALLDGRRDDPDLAAFGEGMRTEVIVLNAPLDADQPAGEPDERSTELPAIQPKSSPATKAPAPAKVAPTTSAQPAVTKPEATKTKAPTGFAVQLGSFSQRANAEKFALGVRDEGFEVFITRAGASSGPVYRVHAGPRSSRAAAENLAGMLAASGRSVMVVDLGGQDN
ncbi:MAG: SPOR domain-containing protein [Gammaproteobacteria bacterium]|jgi:DedD protein|nr:SPOR domain-containing protein [Gammaproteobacteria bacterium]MDP6616328.1 SPOR domain-containing protein [Gammaproteobacteria bacterium]MDP6695916.1 SPOR domain-containing protein [Gammaproteobacteria bacterium]MDP7042297.1 SPOR domain-containing protein [Gammaproteobacteria bacterium]